MINEKEFNNKDIIQDIINDIIKNITNNNECLICLENTNDILVHNKCKINICKECLDYLNQEDELHIYKKCPICREILEIKDKSIIINENIFSNNNYCYLYFPIYYILILYLVIIIFICTIIYSF